MVALRRRILNSDLLCMCRYLRHPGLASSLLFAAATVSLNGCGSSSDPDHGTVAAIVYGNVTRSTGGPAVGALVQGVSYLEGCSGQIIAGSLGTVTDAQGFYRAPLVDIAAPRSMCVVVIVVPGGAGGRDTLTFTGPTLAFRSTEGGEPLDSARVDIRLPN